MLRTIGWPASYELLAAINLHGRPMTRNLAARLTPDSFRELSTHLRIDKSAIYGLSWKTHERGRLIDIGKTFWISGRNYQSPQVLLILSGQWPANESQIATKIDLSLGWNTVDNLHWSDRGSNRTEKIEQRRILMVRAFIETNEPCLGPNLRLGSLCRNNHRWNGHPLSLQAKWGNCWRCRQCERERNQKRDSARQKAWYEANKKKEQRKARERMRVRAQNMTDEQKARQRMTNLQGRHRRRALEKEVTAIRITRWQIRERFNCFNNVCAYCGSDSSLQLEHVVPISRGGTHAIGNIIPACAKCNASKHANEVHSWYKGQDFYSEKRWQKICHVLGWSRSSIGQLALL